MQNGEKFEIPEGPFIMWDGCERAQTEPIVDVSGERAVLPQFRSHNLIVVPIAQALVGLNKKMYGGDCSGPGEGNPCGLTVRVKNKQVWQPESGIDGDQSWSKGSKQANAKAPVVPLKQATTIETTDGHSPPTGFVGVPLPCKAAGACTTLASQVAPTAACPTMNGGGNGGNSQGDSGAAAQGGNVGGSQGSSGGAQPPTPGSNAGNGQGEGGGGEHPPSQADKAGGNQGGDGTAVIGVTCSTLNEDKCVDKQWLMCLPGQSSSELSTSRFPSTQTS